MVMHMLAWREIVSEMGARDVTRETSRCATSQEKLPG